MAGMPGSGHGIGLSRSRLLPPPEPAPSAAVTRLAAYPWLVVATTCVAAIMGQIDASIVQLGLPTLEHAFDARLDAVSWVAVAYVLGFAAALPVFARLAETGGRKSFYLVGFALFGLTSLLCGFAPSLAWLIALRAVQGIGGAMLGANSIVILVAAVGPARRGQALGIFAGSQAVGISIGPAAGGVLLGTLSWHWLFWVSLPLSLLGMLIGWTVLPVTPPGTAEPGFDARGALLLVPGLVALLTAIMELHAWGAMAPATLGCAAAALALLAGFVRQEWRTRAPLLDLSLFASRAFSGGIVAVLLSYAMLYGMFFAMSFALVRGYHDAPLAAGLRLTIIPLALGIVAPFSGGFSERRPRLVMLCGMALCLVAATALRGLLTGAPGSLAGVMAALAIFGAGLGLFIAPNNNATLGAAPAARSGEAGGLLNLVRAFGTGTGVAAASTVLGWRLELATGLHERTMASAPSALLAAVGDVMLLLAACAVLAAAAASLRAGRRLAPA
ncbi:MAG TPA: MFS transporter [Acetobacteraceae bacterium]|nr:MFS transporter [Acetobacteraceae bacterium]